MRRQTHSIRTATGAGLTSLLLGCASTPSMDHEVEKLIERSKESNRALMRGDAERYFEAVQLGDDFTLMSPFGGPPSHGAPTRERMQTIADFFQGGTLEQELVHSYGSTDMVVLAIIERAHVKVGDIPAQEWALRVTLVYRREGADWRLVHRHADPLVDAVSLPQAAALARGERATGG